MRSHWRRLAAGLPIALLMFPLLAHDRESTEAPVAMPCQPIASVDNRTTPPALYGAVAKCIRHDRYPEALALFGLAGVYGRFDGERVSDKTAGQASQVLVMGLFASLPKDAAARFGAAATAMGNDPAALERLCAAVRAVGPPDYYPKYMVLHGMGAVTAALAGGPLDSTLEPNFDARAGWEAAQAGYLHCAVPNAAGAPAAPAGVIAPRAGPLLPAEPPAHPTTVVVPPSVDESPEAQARCHPGLLPSTAPMPPLDVSGLPDPSIGHLKFHFWVNGVGAVTRVEFTASSLAHDADRQTQLDYLKRLTYRVPALDECRGREMELIADFFVHRDASGLWKTLVRLYPRNVYSGAGVLERRE